MNRKLILIIVICFATFTSCKKKLTVNFDLNDTEEFTIPPNSILALPPIITPAFATSSWQGTYQNNNTDKDHVQSCKLTNLTLTIKSPQGKTFGFIKSITVYIQAPNLPNTKIAYINNNPTSAGGTISLVPVDVDLSSYAKADNFTLDVESTVQQYNSDNVDVVANMTLNVTAAVL